MADKITWSNEKRKLSELVPWERNPRQITDKQAKRLEESFEQFGQVEIIAIGPRNEIYNGHQRLKVLSQKYGLNYEVDVRVASRALTEKEREKLTVFLHKGAAGDWDFDVLANEFELDDLLEWGFEKPELDLDLWAPEPPEDVEPQIDKAEELREKWGVKSGDLWKLGEHRLICGDCTDKEVIERLMDGEIAAVFTDPPYGINIVGSNNSQPSQKGRIGGGKCYMDGKPVKPNEYAPVVGDDTTDTAEKFYKLCVELGYKDIIIFGGNYFTAFLPPSPCWLIWDKRDGPASNNFADCELAWTSFTSPARIYRQYWNGAYRKGKKAIEGVSRLHPTQKAVGISENIISDYFKDDMVIFDGFLGSGTTLIACERLGRKCRAVEISPAYVAVAIQRWVDVTGGTPELVD